MLMLLTSCWSWLSAETETLGKSFQARSPTTKRLLRKLLHLVDIENIFTVRQSGGLLALPLIYICIAV